MSTLHRFSHNRVRNAAQLALLAAGGIAVAGAHEARTQISVSAVVRAVANLESQSAPRIVQVSELDVARGYIDVAQPATFVIRGNSPSGFALEVHGISPLISAMQVQGLGSEQLLGAEGGTLVQRWQSPKATALSLHFRFVLAPGMPAGTYQWPLAFSVRPIESL